MRVHIIGSGCPDPRPDRYGSAFILETGDTMLLVDCGPATTYKMARMGISPKRVHHVFLTHHHFDHNVDVPCFALTRWDQCIGPEPPLRVYGPPPTRAFVAKLLGPDGAFFVDWDSRVKHPASHRCHTQRGGSLPRPAPAIVAADIGDGPVAAEGSWAAVAAVVQHVEPTMQSVAYRFDTAEGSVVFAGDCADCTSLRRLATGADTLVITCTHFGTSESPREITDVITGAPEAGAIAREAGVRRVVLTHMSPLFAVPGMRERAVAMVSKAFTGAIVCPDELTSVDVSR